MKLKKLPADENAFHPDGSHFRPTPQQEAEYLRHKHLGLEHESPFQKPLMGFGGEGRPMHPQVPEMSEEDRDKFWAQFVPRGDNEKRMLKGGHGVPLSGELMTQPVVSNTFDSPSACRLHERSVLRANHHRYSPTGIQGHSRHWIVKPLGTVG